ncbi:MAG: hypothetical protein WCX12_02740 [Candidatus Paceibacterota bacterium]|jgi:hypothetical protein
MKSSVQTRFIGSQLTSVGKEVGQGQRLSWPKKRARQREKAERLGKEAAALNISVQELLARKAKDVSRAFTNAAVRVAQENRLLQEEREWLK